jgi:hypothetical protein
MNTAWQQYQTESTVSSITTLKSEKKHLPCLTFCPYPVFKKDIYPMTKEEFELNSFQPEDIFAEKTLKTLQSPDWKMLKVSGPLVGNCFMTQYLPTVKSFDVNISFYIKRDVDIHLYIHNPGEA